jgi:hypothetical protein
MSTRFFSSVPTSAPSASVSSVTSIAVELEGVIRRAVPILDELKSRVGIPLTSSVYPVVSSAPTSAYQKTCPYGYVGTPPTCLPASCPAGYTGSPPYCVASVCPTGFSGVPPFCSLIPAATGATALVSVLSAQQLTITETPTSVPTVLPTSKTEVDVSMHPHYAVEQVRSQVTHSWWTKYHVWVVAFVILLVMVIVYSAYRLRRLGFKTVTTENNKVAPKPIVEQSARSILEQAVGNTSSINTLSQSRAFADITPV